MSAKMAANGIRTHVRTNQRRTFNNDLQHLKLYGSSTFFWELPFL